MPHRAAYKRVRDFLVYRILHVDDTPHRIALGVAIGFFVAWTPTLGFQMMIAVALASLLRANKAVPIPIVWITNPATIIPVYYPNYLIGLWLVDGRHRGLEEWHELLNGFVQPGPGWWSLVRAWWGFTEDIIVPLWLGSCLVGLVLGAATYGLTRFAVRAYRARRARRSHRADHAAA